MARVTVRSVRNYQQEVSAHGHRLRVDEPEELGGDDTGANPYELLLGALGACKSITVQMYARRKGWDLHDVSVELTHDRTHVSDCEDCPEKDVMVDRIVVRMEFAGSLDAGQRARLKAIANRCPVHRTLTGRIEIVDAEEGE